MTAKHKLTSKRNIIPFLVLSFCLHGNFLFGQSPTEPIIRDLVAKALFTLNNHDTTEFKKLFVGIPKNMTGIFFLSQLDIIQPQLSEISSLPIYKIEIIDISNLDYRNQIKKKVNTSIM